MYKRLGPVLFLVFLSFAPLLPAAEPESPLDVFERVWQVAKENVFPDALEARFTDEKHAELVAHATESADIYDLAPAINRFLSSLDVSHTRFLTDHDIDYYVYRSLFTTLEPNRPLVRHIGAQFTESGGEFVVREVFDAYPAAHAGLRRGDVIEKAEGKPFSPWSAFNSTDANPVRLVVRRDDQVLVVPVRPVNENPHQSLFRAMRLGYRTIVVDAGSIGYVRLWTGTHNEILEAFRSIVLEEFIDHDGLILDLRGGFGGAWHDYLDPFFPDRSDYFVPTTVDRTGRASNPPEPRVNPVYFAGPLVVLINEGTRSGKEALAYQFKKTGRATLVGTATAGAFTGGMGIFADEDRPYLLYLAVNETLLDGRRIEGVGVNPDIEIRYPLRSSPESDPQFAAAIERVAGQIAE